MARLSYIVVIAGIALTSILAEELYSSQYDNIDIYEIFNNSKLRTQYYNCFMGTSPCRTADAKFFKEIFSEALQTGCRRCTEKQKQYLEFLIDWYTQNDPVRLQNLITKNIENFQRKNGK